MERKSIFCNICGKRFNAYDLAENYHIHKRLGYGTRFDLSELRLDICCDCMEKLIDSCVLSPVADPEDETARTDNEEFGVIFVEEIPMTGRGKIKRKGKRGAM